MIDKILLAVDGSKNAGRATDVAAELAHKLQAGLYIVHVMMHGRPSQELVRMAEVEHIVEEVHRVLSPGIAYVAGRHPQMLDLKTDEPSAVRVVTAIADQIVAGARTRAHELGADVVETSVRSGDYADEILDAANDFSADLVVLGSRGLGLVASTVLGSVSQKVLHNAQTSVLCVR